MTVASAARNACSISWVVRALAARKNYLILAHIFSIGLKIRMIGRQKDQPRLFRLNGVAHFGPQMAGQIVPDHHVARAQGGD